MNEIDLGFAEERDSAWLTNRYFPSKIGGKPAWLDLEFLPTKQVLECANCQLPKAFLCQIYAPYDDDHNFHRTIYVFYCRSEKCQERNKSRNITVLRSQLPKNNKFFSSEPPSEDAEALPAIPTKSKLCLVCGCLAPFSCSRCKIANYCSAHHQRCHYPQHKKICSNTNTTNNENAVANGVTNQLSPIVFPEWEIVTETFEFDTKAEFENDELEDEQRRLDEYEKLKAEGKTGELKDVNDAELEKYATNTEIEDDKCFRYFKNTTSKEPDQVIRYKRAGEPLWIANVDSSIEQQLLQIPKCEQCGAARQFEFQIMPQMLNILSDATLDWGVVAIYTCKASCKPPGTVGYLQEYAVKQDLISDTK